MGYSPPAKPDADLRRIVREELAKLLQPQLERLGALVGERGPGDGGLKAVRRGDLADAGRVNLTAVPLSVDPVADDFNKVVADLRTIAGLLNRIGANIGGT